MQDGGVWGGAVSPQNSTDLLPGHMAEKRGKRGGGQAQGSSLACQPCCFSDPAEQLSILVQVPRAGVPDEWLEPLTPPGGLCICDVPSHCVSPAGGMHPGQIMPLPLLPTSLPLHP